MLVLNGVWQWRRCKFLYAVIFRVSSEFRRMIINAVSPCFLDHTSSRRRQLSHTRGYW